MGGRREHAFPAYGCEQVETYLGCNSQGLFLVQCGNIGDCREVEVQNRVVQNYIQAPPRRSQFNQHEAHLQDWLEGTEGLQNDQ